MTFSSWMKVLSAFTLLVSGICSAAPKYTVGVEDVAYYPFHDFYRIRDKGILPELLDAFAKRQGIEFDYVMLPVQRFDMWYQENNIDFRIPDNPLWTKGSSQNLTYSQTLVNLCQMTVVLDKNEQLPMAQFDSVGTITGFTPSEKWSRLLAGKEVTITYQHSVMSLTKMLLSGMVTGVDLDIESIRHQLAVLGLPDSKVTIAKNVPISTIGFRLSTQKHQELMRKFDVFLQDNPELLRRLLEKYQVNVEANCVSS